MRLERRSEKVARRGWVDVWRLMWFAEEGDVELDSDSLGLSSPAPDHISRGYPHPTHLTPVQPRFFLPVSICSPGKKLPSTVRPGWTST